MANRVRKPVVIEVRSFWVRSLLLTPGEWPPWTTCHVRARALWNWLLGTIIAPTMATLGLWGAVLGWSNEVRDAIYVNWATFDLDAKVVTACGFIAAVLAESLMLRYSRAVLRHWLSAAFAALWGALFTTALLYFGWSRLITGDLIALFFLSWLAITTTMHLVEAIRLATMPLWAPPLTKSFAWAKYWLCRPVVYR